jgi:hypothetical protein
MNVKQKNAKHPVPLRLRNWAKRIQRGKKFGTVRYPSRFKEEVLSLLQNGVERGVLCKILGISLISLEAWNKANERRQKLPERTQECIRELTLIPDPSEIRDRVRIQVGSKVWIEASAAVLKGALLRELAALGGT